MSYLLTPAKMETIRRNRAKAWEQKYEINKDHPLLQGIELDAVFNLDNGNMVIFSGLCDRPRNSPVVCYSMKDNCFKCWPMDFLVKYRDRIAKASKED